MSKVIAMLCLSLAAGAGAVEWTSGAPRPEIAPAFSRLPQGGRDDGEALGISCDQRSGLQGYWLASYPVTGGTHVRFRAYYRSTGVAAPRRSIMVRLLWAGAATTAARPPLGTIRQDAPCVWPAEVGLYGDPARGMPVMDEFPIIGGTGPDGWTEVSGVYRAPQDAVRVAVELNLQYAPGGSVLWSAVTLEAADPPKPRIARIATVNLEPKGGHEPLDNCRMAAPFVEKAAAQGAQCVVFSEHFATQNLKDYAADPVLASAEAIPGGPISAYFANLARANRIHIVVSIYERDGLCVFNSAVLFGPDGSVIGTYRKVTPTSGEMARGIMPGHELPVFSTSFGRVGMLICYDLQFPEPARELANRGAEIILVPAYGFQTILGQTRAIENQVHLVTSIYEDDGKVEAQRRWGITGIIDPTGAVIARAAGPGTLAIADIDLSPRQWVWLGNWRERLPNHRPLISP